MCGISVSGMSPSASAAFGPLSTRHAPHPAANAAADSPSPGEVLVLPGAHLELTSPNATGGGGAAGAAAHRPLGPAGASGQVSSGLNASLRGASRATADRLAQAEAAVVEPVVTGMPPETEAALLVMGRQGINDYPLTKEVRGWRARAGPFKAAESEGVHRGGERPAGMTWRGLCLGRCAGL